MGDDSEKSDQSGGGLHADDVPPPPVVRPPKAEPSYPKTEQAPPPPPAEPADEDDEDDATEEDGAPEAGSDAKLLGLLCHLLALVGCLVPLIGNVLGPLVLWLLKRNESELVETEGRKSINFQILFSAGVVALWLPTLVVGWIPIVGGLVIWICVMAIMAAVVANVVYILIATMALNAGQKTQYPLSIDVLKLIESKIGKTDSED